MNVSICADGKFTKSSEREKSKLCKRVQNYGQNVLVKHGNSNAYGKPVANEEQHDDELCIDDNRIQTGNRLI